jgi:pSer/pThr/pTyr-binding forkhead associated (FHA) protein
MDNAQEAILIIESGVASTAPLSIGDDPQILGKSNEADITIENPFVSRTHCKIELVDGHYKISDLDSTNGTSINGSDIDRRLDR